MGMEHYQFIKELGGTSGAYLAEDKQDPKRLVVIKQLESGAPGMEELSVSLRVQHPHIIQFQESFVHEGQLYVVLRYERGGDLENFIKKLEKLNRMPTEETVWRWCQQLLEAVRHCHEKKVMHRDIKPGNIFLSEDTKEVFLGDFGSAKSMLPSEQFTSTFMGSPLWISPEVMQGQPYSYSTDMWSIGCVIYEMATLKKPFTSTNFATLVQQITSGDVTPLPTTVSEPMRELIRSLLQLDPCKRPTATEALERVSATLERHQRVLKRDPRARALGEPQSRATPTSSPAPPSPSPSPGEDSRAKPAATAQPAASPSPSRVPPAVGSPQPGRPPPHSQAVVTEAAEARKRKQVELEVAGVGRPPSGRPRSGRRGSLTQPQPGIAKPTSARENNHHHNNNNRRYPAPQRGRVGGGDGSGRQTSGTVTPLQEVIHRKAIGTPLQPPEHLPRRAAAAAASGAANHPSSGPSPSRVAGGASRPVVPPRLVEGVAAARRLTPLQAPVREEKSSPKHPKSQPQSRKSDMAELSTQKSNSLPGSLTRLNCHLHGVLPGAEEQRVRNAKIPSSKGSGGADKAGGTAGFRENQWVRAKNDDVSAIENYLHKFRDKDAAVLRQVEPFPPPTQQIHSRPAHNPVRPGALEAVSKVEVPTRQPPARNDDRSHPEPPFPVYAKRKAPVRQGPSPARPNNLNPPHNLKGNALEPTPMFEHRRRMKVMQHQQDASPTREGKAPRVPQYQPLVDPEVAERAKNHLRSHQPRQVSHARPAKVLSEEDRLELELERHRAQEIREMERKEMREKIRQARREQNVKDVKVEIVLPV